MGRCLGLRGKGGRLGVLLTRNTIPRLRSATAASKTNVYEQAREGARG
jgi:hypothetical protein